jgi:hypothetical protein
MSPSLGWIASGTNEDGESADRGTGCANVRTSGSVGALVGNRQGHPARSEFQTFLFVPPDLLDWIRDERIVTFSRVTTVS